MSISNVLSSLPSFSIRHSGGRSFLIAELPQTTATQIVACLPRPQYRGRAVRVVEITAEAARYPGTRKISVGQEFVSAAEASRAMGVLFNLTALEFSKVRKQEKEKGIDPTGRATARGVVFEYCFRP